MWSYMDPAAVNMLSSPACTGCSTRPLSSVYVICQPIAAVLQIFRAQGVTKRQAAAAIVKPEPKKKKTNPR
jgi:hypothetical protein